MCVDGVAKSEGSAEDECQADQNQLEDADKLECARPIELVQLHRQLRCTIYNMPGVLMKWLLVPG